MAKFSDLNIHDIGTQLQLVGAVWAQDDRGYLCFFPGEGELVDLVPMNMSTDDWAQFLRQTDLLEVEMFERDENGKLTKAIVRKSQRQVSQHVSWEVFRRDGYTCRYCGNGEVPLTVDHLVLWEEGGPSIVENLVSACKKCNRVRGNTQYEDWLRHPYYVEKSKNLTNRTQVLNRNVLANLEHIPRVKNIPAKRK